MSARGGGRAGGHGDSESPGEPRKAADGPSTGKAVRSAGSLSAGRVVAGTARGTRLAAPGEGTRPLADRVKEALFAILEPDLHDARVLDLFAGSGAAGIEALSRGAAAAVFVERDRTAVATIKANLDRTHLLGPDAIVIREDATTWLASAAARRAGPFDVAFADPPYDRPELLLAALEVLGAGGIVAAGGRVIAKHFWRDPPPAAIGLLASDRERRFGDTALTFYRVGGSVEAGPADPADADAAEETE